MVGGVSRADTEVDHAQAVVVGRGLHGSFLADDIAVESLGEVVQITTEVGQEDVITEAIDRHAGIARQPVARDGEAVGSRCTGVDG